MHDEGPAPFHSRPPRANQSVSSFAVVSIQSTAASERKKASGPDSPTHHGLEATAPPADAILLISSGDTASPLWAMSHPLAAGSSFAHHSMISGQAPARGVVVGDPSAVVV